MKLQSVGCSKRATGSSSVTTLMRRCHSHSDSFDSDIFCLFSQCYLMLFMCFAKLVGDG